MCTHMPTCSVHTHTCTHSRHMQYAHTNVPKWSIYTCTHKYVDIQEVYTHTICIRCRKWRNQVRTDLEAFYKAFIVLEIM